MPPIDIRSPAAAPLTIADWRDTGLREGADAAAARLTALANRLRRRQDSDPAWIHVADDEQVAAQLRVIAQRRSALPDHAALLRAMPLYGVPFAVKDNIDVAGWPTTAACPAFRRIATVSAGAVLRLQAAGAVCIGKTNLDQFATGLVGTRSPYGRPASVFAPDRVSGGSSSGSAVVVASGALPFALGTDTAGSGRVPAGFNHIVGLKPTPGRVGTSGVLPACRSLDCVSVFALTAGDAAQVLAVIEGDDAADAYSAFAPGPARWAGDLAGDMSGRAAAGHAAEAAAAAAGAAAGAAAAADRVALDGHAVSTAPAGSADRTMPGDRAAPADPTACLSLSAAPPPLRIGVPARPRFGATDGYAACWQRAVDHLGALGHTVVAVDFAPLHATAELLYDGPWVAERHAVVQELLARDPAAFDPAVRRVVEAANRYSATDAFRGQYRLREAQRDAAALWQRVDVLMVPTAPAHPRFADVDADPMGSNAALGTYTNFVNLLGWCALALPFGFTGAASNAGPAGPGRAAGAAERLPFGVTFIAPGGHDAALARFGVGWQAALALPLGATAAPYRPDEAPLSWPAAAPTLPLAVVGAHLSGLPLNGQLGERGGVLRAVAHTAPHYRLYALPGARPAKPGLLRVNDGGAAIAVEVWDLPLGEVGGFLAEVPPPLGLGSVELADGSWVHGFLCEAHALQGARDISAFGGWRAYLQSLAPGVGSSVTAAQSVDGSAVPIPTAAGGPATAANATAASRAGTRSSR